MHVHLQRFSVPYEYPVVFTEDVFAPENPALLEVLTRREPDKRHRLCFVVDGGVDRATPVLKGRIAAWTAAHPRSVELAADPEVVEGGEGAKNDPGMVRALQARFGELKLDRHSFVVIVGGGSLLDAAGYAAATTHRGLRVVRLPTTVLGQNDSGVGVKNGVNAFGLKNFLGSFAPPFAVVSDARFIDTLPRRDRIAGAAEAVKVALIRDLAFYRFIEEHADALAACDREATIAMIRRSAELHLQHIAGSGDPFEQGSARPLDFGHWAAHKLESMTAHALRHGEAVAIGIALDLRYSTLTGRLSESELEEVCALMERIGLRLRHDALLESTGGRLRVLDGLDEFREHLGGRLTLTLLSGIGRGIEVNEIDEALMADAIRWLFERTPGRGGGGPSP